jgi:hypothetical protein
VKQRHRLAVAAAVPALNKWGQSHQNIMDNHILPGTNFAVDFPVLLLESEPLEVRRMKWTEELEEQEGLIGQLVVEPPQLPSGRGYPKSRVSFDNCEA